MSDRDPLQSHKASDADSHPSTSANPSGSENFSEIMRGMSPQDRDMILARAQRGKELCEMAPIMSQMPFSFPGTKYKIQEFKEDCGFCQRKIGDQFLRGRIELGFPTVAYVEAIGLCEHCLKCTRYEYRLHDDGAITGLRAGRWQRWESAKGSASTTSNNSNEPDRLQKGAPSASSSGKPGFLARFAQSFAATLLFLPYLVFQWGAWMLTKPRGPEKCDEGDKGDKSGKDKDRGDGH